MTGQLVATSRMMQACKRDRATARPGASRHHQARLIVAHVEMFAHGPVRHAGSNQLIRDTRVADKSWARKHWTTLLQNYSRADYFADQRPFFEQLYLSMDEEFLSDVNYRFMAAVNEQLGIVTRISSTLRPPDEPE